MVLNAGVIPDPLSDLTVGEISVNSRVVRTGTTNSERDNSGESSVEDGWATAVALARVLSGSCSTEHPRCDSDASAVGLLASGTFDDVYFNGHQGRGTAFGSFLQLRQSNQHTSRRRTFLMRYPP